MTKRPFDHLPRTVADTILGTIAPHVLPAWSGNQRVRIIPPGGEWCGELAGMPCVNTLHALTQLLKKSPKSARSIYYRNTDRKLANQVDKLLLDLKSRCIVYIRR